MKQETTPNPLANGEQNYSRLLNFRFIISFDF